MMMAGWSRCPAPSPQTRLRATFSPEDHGAGARIPQRVACSKVSVRPISMNSIGGDCTVPDVAVDLRASDDNAVARKGRDPVPDRSFGYQNIAKVTECVQQEGVAGTDVVGVFNAILHSSTAVPCMSWWCRTWSRTSVSICNTATWPPRMLRQLLLVNLPRRFPR